jgi:pimeloyl-ACP methyl ester carboxylesterase
MSNASLPTRSIRAGAAALLVAGCASAPSPAPRAAAASPPPLPSLATAEDRFVTVGDVRLRYREVGRGEPVLLVHGFARTLDDWRRVADSLAAGTPGYRVIALDLRGFGGSSKFADPARYGAELVEDVGRVLDQARARRVHVVGHALGANVAARFALRHADRVITLTLADGYARDSAALRTLVAEWAAGIERGQGLAPMIAWASPTLPDSAVAVASRTEMARNDSAALLAVLRTSGAAVIPRAQAARARVPTLLIAGSNDPLADDTRRMSEWWPESHLVVLDGATHDDLLERPEFLARLRAHLATRPPSPVRGYE